jgi:predicted nucleotide-binding protein
MASESGRDADRRRRVFIIHGRNRHAKDAIGSFLRALSLKPIPWDQAAEPVGGSPYNLEVVQAGLADAQAAVVVLTGDDLATLLPELALPHERRRAARRQARPNVMLEAGMALASLGRERTIVVEFGEILGPSDLRGIEALQLHRGSAGAIQAFRSSLASRLRAAGCPVDLNQGDDWLRVDFEQSFVPSRSAPRRVLAGIVALSLAGVLIAVVARRQRTEPAHPVPISDGAKPGTVGPAVPAPVDRLQPFGKTIRAMLGDEFDAKQLRGSEELVARAEKLLASPRKASPAQIAELIQQAKEVVNSSNPEVVARAVYVRLMCLAPEKKWDEIIEQAVPAVQELGNPRYAAAIRLYEAEARESLGQLDRALAAFEDARRRAAIKELQILDPAEMIRQSGDALATRRIAALRVLVRLNPKTFWVYDSVGSGRDARLLSALRAHGVDGKAGGNWGWAFPTTYLYVRNAADKTRAVASVFEELGVQSVKTQLPVNSIGPSAPRLFAENADLAFLLVLAKSEPLRADLAPLGMPADAPDPAPTPAVLREPSAPPKPRSVSP